MDDRKRTLLLSLAKVALFGWLCVSSDVAQAHFGGIIVQLQNGQLITGLDNEEPGGVPDWNVRSYGSLFSPNQFSDLPSFLSLASAPAGTEPLPPGTNLYWDFLPMTTDCVTSNLLYWDGQGTTLADVEFGPVPVVPPATDVTLGIYNTTDGTSALVSDTPEMVPGALLGVTDNTGSGLRLHRHNYFLLDDGDGGIPPTTVPEGVYLIAMQLRMPGYGTSRPFFVVPGTYGLVSTSLPSLAAALEWVEQNADELILDGDYLFDGKVDQADYTAWHQQFGSTGPFPMNDAYADGNRDTLVNAADYVFWRDNLGAASCDTMAGSLTHVPEPGMFVQFGLLAAMLAIWRRRRSKHA